MTQGIERLRERLLQLGKPDSLDENVVTSYLLQADESLLEDMLDTVISDALPYYDAPLLAELDKIIADSALSDVRRLYAARLLQEFSCLHPEYYGRIIKALGAQLQRYGSNPPVLNGQLVSTCITLQAEELMPVIEAVYENNSVESALYSDFAAAQFAMQEPETAFESGLEMFMHTRELDEIRQQLETCFGPGQDAAAISNVMALDGFFHALSLSAVTVSPSIWLSQISQATDKQDQEYITDMLMTYYSEVADAMQANSPELYMQPSADANELKQWATGFLHGYQLLVADTEEAEFSQEANKELISSMRALASEGHMPVQYETLGQGDISMIIQLMLLRAFAELE